MQKKILGKWRQVGPLKVQRICPGGHGCVKQLWVDDGGKIIGYTLADVRRVAANAAKVQIKPFAALMKMLEDRRVKTCERDSDGYWVYLKSGWNNGDGGEHAIHEDSWVECWDKFQGIEKCDCEGCVDAKRKA